VYFKFSQIGQLHYLDATSPEKKQRRAEDRKYVPLWGVFGISPQKNYRLETFSTDKKLF